MENTDRAIVVGIQCYPGIGMLDGPDNDAHDFCDWLTAENGGGLKPKNVKLIVTPTKKMAVKKAEKAVPVYQQVQDEVNRLIAEANKNPRKGDDSHKYIGRRLYLYFAGHGFAFREEGTALIMANATDMLLGAGYHWLGLRSANWFYQAGYFDEVVLLMDCCRSYLPVPVPSWSLKDEFAPDYQTRVKIFFAYAAPYGKETVGVPDSNGKVHGKFTTALLKGLRTFGNVPGSDIVTTDTLAAYIRTQLPELQQSDFTLGSFNLAKISEPAAQCQVTVHIPPQAIGKAIQVIDSSFNVVCRDVTAGPQWQVLLSKGFYLVQVLELGLQAKVPVDSSEVLDVQLS